MTYDQFLALCNERRTIRYFDDKPIDKKDILKLLELARQAPSVENLQPWHFHVVLNADTRKKLMESSCYGNFVEGAGAFIVVTVNRSLQNEAQEIVWNPRELDYSCIAAMEHMLLGATALGFGSSWVSLHHGGAHDVLKLSPHEAVVGGIMVGHFKKGEEKASGGRQRKPLEEMYTLHE